MNKVFILVKPTGFVTWCRNPLSIEVRPQTPQDSSPQDSSSQDSSPQDSRTQALKPSRCSSYTQGLDLAMLLLTSKTIYLVMMTSRYYKGARTKATNLLQAELTQCQSLLQVPASPADETLCLKAMALYKGI